MTAVELLNLALLKIGVSKGITATTDATREAYTGAAVFDHRLRKCLRRFPWSFATKYADLYLTQGPVYSTDSLVQAWSGTDTYAVGDVVEDTAVQYRCILAHSASHQPPNATYWEVDDSTDQANGDWVYAYRHPSDCLFVRRVVPASLTGRAFNANPDPFRIGRDANGLLVYSNAPDLTIEYTVIDCDSLWADDLFIDYYTWDLAASLAPSLAQNGLTARDCLAMAELTLQTAATVSSNEQQQEKPGEADWIQVR